MSKTPLNKPKAVMCWSSGKDSAYALYRVLQKADYEVVGLLTTLSEDRRRIPMHEISEELLDKQALALALPLHKVFIPANCPNSIYEKRFLEAAAKFKNEGVTHFIFGDLFLEDIRKYREKMLTGSGITPVFPLWGENSGIIAKKLIELDFKAVVTGVMTEKMSPNFVGRIFGPAFLKDLPKGIDPCGENGEFHTFVFDGPNFRNLIPFHVGPRYTRDPLSHISLV